LGVAALAATFLWGNALASRAATGGGMSDVLLETACLAIVLAALGVVAAQLWIRLVRRTDHALAQLPPGAEYAHADELGRLTQALEHLSAARTRDIAADAARQRRLSQELTRRNAHGLSCLQQVAALLVEAPLSQFSLIKVLQVLAAGLGADSAALQLSPATRDSLRCPTLLGSHDVTFALAMGAAEIAAATTTVQVFGSGESRVRCLSVPLRHGSTIIAVLVVQAPESFEFDETPLQLAQTTAMLLALALTGWSRGQEERRGALLEERAAIARELHDSLAQSLAFLKIQVARLQAALREAPAQGLATTDTASQLRDGVSSAYRQVKELIAAFRVRMGSHGLSGALEEAVDEFSQRSGLVIALDNRLGDIRLTVNEEFHVLQVVREALSNTVRHARAAHVSVSLTATPGGPVVAAVQDDGRGFSQPIAEPQHYGLSIMRERAASLGGELSIHAQEDAGTRVCLSFMPACAAPQPSAPY
ncbi:MAG TPA: histidine kinase, partial [Burkholderiales bacterium]|nr:histidine kinase [Burkholderiales bacterium]